jgi:Fe2+ transport system protein FeoA
LIFIETHDDIENQSNNHKISACIIQRRPRSMFKQWFGRHRQARGCKKMAPAPPGPDRTLDCLKLNESGEIDTVPEEALLEALGFRPGKRVCVKCRTRFGGPLIAEVEGRHTALGRDLARKIRLRKHCCSCPDNE